MILSLIKYIPKRFVSALIGKLAAIEAPQFINQRVIKWYITRYRVDLSDIAQPLTEYKSLAKFFVRDLKSDARTQAQGLTSPCDAELRSIQTVQSGTLEQIKGINYTLEVLLGSSKFPQRFEGGNCYNLYLSPRDYHQVHSPIDAAITSITYIPGNLWPVNDWALKNISQLFCRNERVVIELESAEGTLAVVMVGAFNVGSIRLNIADLVTNRAEVAIRSIIPKVQKVQKGDKLGAFHMGSSVILLTATNFLKPVKDTGFVLVGETLAV